MRTWKMALAEPGLDELLGDEIMSAVMRSAGLSVEELRAQLADMARRLAPRDYEPGGSGRRAAA